MNRRDLIRMSDEEIHSFLQEQRTLQVATIDHDGWPHLVAMWYALINSVSSLATNEEAPGEASNAVLHSQAGQKEYEVAFGTYAKSQKAVNLRRDPRLTCLVETGEQYNELRGVQIKGEAVISDDPATVQRIGEIIWQRYTGPLNENTRSMVAAQAAKRVVVFVRTVEIVSWDHRKLGGGY